MSGKNLLTPIAERLAARSVRENRGYPTPCLIWKGDLDSFGYGRITRGRRGEGIVRTFRVAWETQRGPVPEGKQLDHLCRQRDCHEVTHLEPVTSRENILRGLCPAAENARKTHCIHGHPLSGENLRTTPRGHRICRKCRQAIDRRAYVARSH